MPIYTNECNAYDIISGIIQSATIVYFIAFAMIRLCKCGFAIGMTAASNGRNSYG